MTMQTNDNFIKTVKTKRNQQQYNEAPKRPKKEDKHAWQRTDKRKAYE